MHDVGKGQRTTGPRTSLRYGLRLLEWVLGSGVGMTAYYLGLRPAGEAPPISSLALPFAIPIFSLPVLAAWVTSALFVDRWRPLSYLFAAAPAWMWVQLARKATTWALAGA